LSYGPQIVGHSTPPTAIVSVRPVSPIGTTLSRGERPGL